MPRFIKTVGNRWFATDKIVSISALPEVPADVAVAESYRYAFGPRVVVATVDRQNHVIMFDDDAAAETEAARLIGILNNY